MYHKVFGTLLVIIKIFQVVWAGDKPFHTSRGLALQWRLLGPQLWEHRYLLMARSTPCATPDTHFCWRITQSPRVIKEVDGRSLWVTDEGHTLYFLWVVDQGFHVCKLPLICEKEREKERRKEEEDLKVISRERSMQ